MTYSTDVSNAINGNIYHYITKAYYTTAYVRVRNKSLFLIHSTTIRNCNYDYIA